MGWRFRAVFLFSSRGCEVVLEVLYARAVSTADIRFSIEPLCGAESLWDKQRELPPSSVEWWFWAAGASMASSLSPRLQATVVNDRLFFQEGTQSILADRRLSRRPYPLDRLVDPTAQTTPR